MRPEGPVTILLRDLPDGGVERAYLRLAEGMLAEGVTVDLVIFEKSGALSPSVPAGVRTIELGIGSSEKSVPWRILIGLFRLIRYLRRRRPIAVISAKEQANAVNVLGCLLSLTGTKKIVSRHVPILNAPHGTDAGWYTPLLYRFLMSRADSIVAVSKGIAKEIESMIPARNCPPIHVVPNAVLGDDFDTQLHAPCPLDRAPEGSQFVVAIGRLSRQKGFDVLLCAFARTMHRHAASLVILGDGPDREALSALAADLGLGDRVIWAGQVATPYPYLRRASLFVLSSRWEGMPTVLIEALAAGTPVVSTDCPTGPSELLAADCLVPPEDEAALAEAILSRLSRTPAPPPFDARPYFTRAATRAYLALFTTRDS